MPNSQPTIKARLHLGLSGKDQPKRVSIPVVFTDEVNFLPFFLPALDRLFDHAEETDTKINTLFIEVL